MGEPKLILIVDDEEPNRALLQAMVKSFGYESELAGDGLEALAKIGPRVDLVLMDVMMPEMDGFEVVERIRYIQDCKDVPIIMVTILTSKEDRLRAVEAGANDFINKPVDKLELRVRMESLLKMKEAQDALKRSEARYRSLVENSPVAIVSCDTEGRIVEWNPALLSLLRIASDDEARSFNLLTTASLVDAGAASLVRKCLASGAPSVGEFQHKDQWGRRTHIRMHVVPWLMGDSSVVGAQAALEDISDNKRSEGLLLRSERLRALVEMAGGAAQSFDNSLHIVAGGAQTALNLLETRSFAQLRSVLEDVRNHSNQAAQKVRLLQQFARSRTALGTAEGKVFDLNKAVQLAVDETEPWWKPKAQPETVPITLETELGAQCFVQGEEVEFIDAIVNLIKNAAESMPNGGALRVRTIVEEGYVILEVEDEGMGIPKRDMAKVGEPFWTSKPGHSGMGLAVSVGTIRRHQGTLAITSKKSRGTIFSVRLPQVADPSTNRQMPTRAIAPSRYSILVVHQDERTLKSLEGQLQKLGQTALAAASSGQALKLLQDNQVEAVVCSAAVSDVSAWDLSTAITEACLNRRLHKPPFILLTGPDDEISPEEMGAHPDVDYIFKEPLDLAALLETMGRQARRPELHADFTGNIGGIDILEYVQLVLFTGQQVILEILSKDGKRGLLFIDRGEIRHASCNGTEGEEALYQCLSFKGGSFSSLPWREPDRNTIKRPGEFLLIEAARRRDELRGGGQEDSDD